MDSVSKRRLCRNPDLPWWAPIGIAKANRCTKVCLIGEEESGKTSILGHQLALHGAQGCGQFGPGATEYERLALDQCAPSRSNQVYEKFSVLLDEQHWIGGTKPHVVELWTAEDLLQIVDLPGRLSSFKNALPHIWLADIAVVVVNAHYHPHGHPERCLCDICRDRSIGLTAQLLHLLQHCGVAQIIVAVNKMDQSRLSHYDQWSEIPAWSQAHYEQLVNRIKKTCNDALDNVRFVPLSAWTGENLVQGSVKMPWAPSNLLSCILSLAEQQASPAESNMNLPTQMVLHRVFGHSRQPQSASHRAFSATRAYAHLTKGTITVGDLLPTSPPVLSRRMHQVIIAVWICAVAWHPRGDATSLWGAIHRAGLMESVLEHMLPLVRVCSIGLHGAAVSTAAADCLVSLELEVAVNFGDHCPLRAGLVLGLWSPAVRSAVLQLSLPLGKRFCLDSQLRECLAFYRGGRTVCRPARRACEGNRKGESASRAHNASQGEEVDATRILVRFDKPIPIGAGDSMALFRYQRNQSKGRTCVHSDVEHEMIQAIVVSV